MDCRKVRQVVFLYTDNEMDGELLVSFEEHVSICPECARQAGYAKRLVTVVRKRCTRRRAPSALRQRILTSLHARQSGE